MSKGLCFRCENRATALEGGARPRHECGQSEMNKWACYCYQPVKPVMLKRNEGDERPLASAWMISARGHIAKEQPKMVLTGYWEGEDRVLMYWKPESEKEDN